MKKKLVVKLMFCLVIFCSLCFLFGCNNPVNINYNIKYSSTEGGYIRGTANQVIDKGADAEEVVAVALNEYRFFEWSDGLKEAKRQDKSICSQLNIVAKFKKIKHKVTYSANEGGRIEGQVHQVVEIGKSTNLIAAKPEEGYIFIKWSDGLLSPDRADKVIEDKIFIAEFQKIFNGIGTQTDPYQIVDYKSLQNMKYYPQSYYKLMNNLDFKNMLYEPVFDATYRFKGFFDGGGFSINNLIFDSNAKYPSLFGVIDVYAKIENLNINHFVFNMKEKEDSSVFVGAIASISHGELENIIVSGDLNIKDALK